MQKKQFICAKCQKHVELDILEHGEAEAKRLIASPAKCPQCHSTALIDPKEFN